MQKNWINQENGATVAALFLCVFAAGCGFYPTFIVMNSSGSDIQLSVGKIDRAIEKGKSFDFRFKSESMGVASITEGACSYSYQISEYLIENRLLEPKEGELVLIYAGEGQLSLRADTLNDISAKQCIDNPAVCVIPAQSTCS